MNGLFINYRREDTAPYAGRLYDFLQRAFPEIKVFMDIDAIDPGEDFISAIDKTLTASGIVLAVIGPDWEQLTDGTGTRRLDNPDDYVVRELAAALESSARVIPVLVGGAAMPRSDTLPERLRPLARRHAIEISDTRFTSDSERLSLAISKIVRPPIAGEEKSKLKQAGTPGQDAELADKFVTFKTLLWTNFALGFVTVFLQIVRTPGEEVVGLIITDILVMAFSVWLNLMLIRGKNWARLTYLVLMILVSPALFFVLSEQSGAEITVNILGLLLSVWLLRVMFSEPIKRKFMRAQ